MIPAAKAALDAIVGNVAALAHAKGAGRAYELYIMTGIATGLKKDSCDVWVQRSDGTRISPTDLDRKFVQRGGAPSGVSGASQGQGNASSLVFSLPDSTRVWEIWNGIQFIGRSSGSHELDISIVAKEVGDALRLKPTGGCPIGRPKVSIECKDVGTAGNTDEMRALIARLYDLSILDSHKAVPHIPKPLQAIHPGSPSNNDPHRTFWEGNRTTFNVIARRTGFASGALAMTNYYGIQPRGPIVVGSAEYNKLINDLIAWIMKNLK